MSTLPSWFRSTSLQVMIETDWPPCSPVTKYFQTSGCLSWLVSDVMTCLPLSLQRLRSTDGSAGTFEFAAIPTVSACCVLPHPVKPAAPAVATAATHAQAHAVLALMR